MKSSKVILTPQAHKIITEAQGITGLSRMDHVIGALLEKLVAKDDPQKIAQKIMEGLPDYMRQLHAFYEDQEAEKRKSEKAAARKKKRKARAKKANTGSA